MDSGGIRVFRLSVWCTIGSNKFNVLCKDLPAVPQCSAELHAHRAARLPALLRPRLLHHRARAGAGEHRGIRADARGSVRGVAAAGFPRPLGYGPVGGARRPADADAGSWWTGTGRPGAGIPSPEPASRRATPGDTEGGNRAAGSPRPECGTAEEPQSKPPGSESRAETVSVRSPRAHPSAPKEANSNIINYFSFSLKTLTNRWFLEDV